MLAAITGWSSRRWMFAAAASVLVALAVGIPSDVIPNPVFGRPTVPVTWWAYPVLVATAVLGGLLAATYVREAPESTFAAPAATDGADGDLDAPGRAGGIGGLLSFFAIGCPTCNKLIVLAIGTTGALDWFAPAQPILAAVSIVLLGWALHVRLRDADSCRIATPLGPTGNMVG